MPVFCKNCGTKLNDNMRFCPSCGEVITGEVQNSQQNLQQLPQGMFYDAQGGIHWHYTRKMIRHPEILLKFLKIYSILIAAAFVFVGIIRCIEEEDIEVLGEMLIPMLIIFAAGVAGSIIIWLIVCAVRGGKEEMDFVLNDREIAYVIDPKRAEKNRKIAAVGEVAGLLAGDPSLMMQAEIAGENAGGVGSPLNSITLIDARRKSEMMWVKVNIERNAIYINPHQYDFILQTLKRRCPNAVVKGE